MFVMCANHTAECHPLLTIITVTRDDARGLELTLASAARWHNHEKVEHVVVYHGESPAKADKSCRLHRQMSHGIAPAFNEGLNIAQGEWVWFLNGGDAVDERLDPDWLISLLGAAAADIIIGGITYSEDGVFRLNPVASDCWPPIKPWIPHPASLIRRGLFGRMGGFDERYTIAMDYEWWLRVYTRGARLDVVSFPFAVFAGGGISQRPESRSRLTAEKNRAIRHHAFRLWRLWIRGALRLTRDSLAGAFSRRR
jgi:hypothetical protein